MERYEQLLITPLAACPMVWRSRCRVRDMTPAARNCPDQRQDALVGHPTAHLFHQESVMERPETVLDVAFYHPLIAAGWR